MSDLNFTVQYYDDHHRQALQNMTFSDSLNHLIQNGLVGQGEIQRA